MAQLLEAFVLGNAAILGNVCLLPLYPGLIAFLAGSRLSKWYLGATVLAGVLSATVVLGLVFYSLSSPVAAALPVLLPLLYGVVALIGLGLIVNWQPRRWPSLASPRLLDSRPMLSAFTYGLLLGPMTLPCTGPLVISAFVVGGIAGSGALLDGLGYYVAFGLGFGWPLVALPLLALPFQRRLTRWLARRHRWIQVISGVILLVIAAVGLVLEVAPNYS